jgi:ubiquinone/menaquinone biosynthesis C-methylase UbiE
MSKAEFDQFAAHYEDLHRQNISITGEQPEYFAEYKMRDFAQLARAAGRPLDGQYLDFGSGIGASVAPFRRHLGHARLVCADVSSESLAQAEAAHGDAASYLLLEDGQLPLAARSVDGAFACCVFHHIAPAEHVRALQEVRRVLKPGGLLMVYEHNPFNPLTVHAVNTCPLDENAILIRARLMRERCEAAGFRDIDAQYRVFFPAALSALRPMENWLRWLPLGGQYFVSARA